MKILYIEYLRFLAAISVIMIHITGRAVYVLGENVRTNSEIFITSVSIDSFFRFCVPIFFMISGALVFKKEEINIKSFLINRFNRIVVPVIVWGYAYSFTYNKGMTFIEHTKNVLLGNGFYHLWFLYSIIGIYLITPIIHKFIKNSSKREIEYLIGIGLICNFIIPIVNKNFSIDLGATLNLNYVSGYLMYFILGYYLMMYDIKILNNRKNCTIVYLVSTIIMMLSTLVVSFIEGKYNVLFIQYSWILVVIQSIAIFCLFKSIEFKDDRIIKLSSLFMGIYILHIFILEGYQNMWNIDYNTLSIFIYLIYILIGIIYIYVVTSALVYVLKRVPIVKNVL
ncbi:acyltransferase family protein [Clostridium baratii]|uniref:acyltransferase n=1 Tax=Clostridium baratii TaxID=1561 RepID=UPI0028FDC56D|nr:acyltransferase family protein [Clostridium baratii]